MYITKKKQTHRYREETSREREAGRGKMGYGMKRYKLLCIKQISNKDILYSIGRYSQYFVITLNGV